MNISLVSSNGIKCTCYILSIFIFTGCTPPGPSESEISQCVRYNTDRFEQREFDRKWEAARGFHEACNRLERSLGGTGCESPKPRLRQEAIQESKKKSEFFKEQCSVDLLYVY